MNAAGYHEEIETHGIIWSHALQIASRKSLVAQTFLSASNGISPILATRLNSRS